MMMLFGKLHYQLKPLISKTFLDLLLVCAVHTLVVAVLFPFIHILRIDFGPQGTKPHLY